jgi:hypothetical protein
MQRRKPKSLRELAREKDGAKVVADAAAAAVFLARARKEVAAQLRAKAAKRKRATTRADASEAR